MGHHGIYLRSPETEQAGHRTKCNPGGVNYKTESTYDFGCGLSHEMVT